MSATPNLVTLVAAYIPLKESRRSLRGTCPFHPDAGESFMVSPKKNIFKCFNCGKEGGPEEFSQAITQLKNA